MEPEGVDFILADLPYGTTHNEWDLNIDLNQLWKLFRKLIKPNTAVVLFGQGMFTARLMLFEEKIWRYNLIWKKGNRASGFLNANKMPLRNHEDILVFYQYPPIFNPQFRKGKSTHKKGLPNAETNRNYGSFNVIETRHYGEDKFPISVLDFERPHPPLHPTQKPVELCEWLINTFSNKDQIVFDCSAGIGTTCVAAKNLNRKSIGIEIEPKYCEIAVKRLRQEVFDFRKG